MAIFHYIYFSEDDSYIGAGTFEGEEDGLTQEVPKAIRKDTNGADSYLHFGVIVSRKTNFLEEAQKHGDVKAYLQGIVNQIHNIDEEE
jgi:hypothetical protein